jgi:hypothetical protein
MRDTGLLQSLYRVAPPTARTWNMEVIPGMRPSIFIIGNQQSAINVFHNILGARIQINTPCDRIADCDIMA